jgi:hypothetical protein
MAEHCVRLYFPYSESDLGSLFALEDALTAAIEMAGAGEFDGNEVGEGEAVLYMYGPDADVLFQAILPVLKESPLLRTGVAVRRNGPPKDGVREVRSLFPVGES